MQPTAVSPPGSLSYSRCCRPTPGVVVVRACSCTALYKKISEISDISGTPWIGQDWCRVLSKFAERNPGKEGNTDRQTDGRTDCEVR